MNNTISSFNVISGKKIIDSSGSVEGIVNNFTELARLSSFSAGDKCCCDDYIKEKPKKKQRYNCPNCGAPITGPRCAYCDTLLVEPTYYQYNIPYPNEGSYCNIRQQLEEAQARAAQNMQTNFILQSIQPFIPRPASLGTVKTR